MSDVSSEITFSVIIVNYNGGDYLAGALDSLRSQTRRDFEVILIDNASTDGSADDISGDGLPHYAFLPQSSNLGFAAANNLGARAARGQWLALLNPDAEAAPDWLDQIAKASARHPDTKVFACAQLDLHEPDRLDGAGDAYLVFGFPWRGGFQRPVEELPGEGECFSPCGASAVYDRDVFLGHDGFDERYFCYCEDVDLGFRMQLAGERCIFLPEAKVAHAGSGTSGRDSYFTAYHGNRNRAWTYVKNTPWPLLLFTLPGHVAILAYIYFRNRSRLPHTGMKDGIRDGLKSAWSLRVSTAYRGPAWPTDWRRFLSILAWNPWAISDHRTLVRTGKVDKKHSA